jgi:hypothetical protein
MAGNGLCGEAWAAVLLIAGACVFVCLSAVARALEIEARRLELHRQVLLLRKKYATNAGRRAA